MKILQVLCLLTSFICSILIAINKEKPMASTKKIVKNKKPVSAFSLFPKSYNAIMQNLFLFIVVGGFGLVAQLILSLQIKVPEEATGFPTISSQGAGIFTVALIVSIVLYTMSIKLQLSVARGNKPTMNALWGICSR
jgi:hypothetical protein